MMMWRPSLNACSAAVMSVGRNSSTTRFGAACATRAAGSQFQTRAFSMGKQLINIDNTAETLARLEGETFK
jgi:hypothetical protein